MCNRNDSGITMRFFLKKITVALVLFFPFIAFPQSPFNGFENLFIIPNNYTVSYTTKGPIIDGDLNDQVWQRAKWTTNFRDIEGDLKPFPSTQTKAKMLWDDSCLYIAAEINDPNVCASLKHHDDIVFNDNDFEIFLNPVNNTTSQYYEFEFNAINTVFDLFLNKPYRDGGNAMINWNADGLRSAVKVQGTLNDPSDTDKGWTVEIAIPFRSVNLNAGDKAPEDGSLWRINFSRVEWDAKVVNGKYIKLKDSTGHNLPEHNWVWSPQGVINMHFPERWGYLIFSKNNTDIKPFALPYQDLQMRYLWLVYYKQAEWYLKHGTYTANLGDLGLNGKATIDNHSNLLYIEATKHQYMAVIKDEDGKISYTINQEGLTGSLK